MALNPVHFSSKDQSWETPEDVFRPLQKEFNLTHDVCATPENTKCESFWSPVENALTQKWSGNLWMNPPYGRGVGEWVKKAAEANALVVCLLPARTDTKWWHEYVIKKAKEIRFLRGRIRFVGAKAGCPFPCAVVIFDGTVKEKVA